MCRASRLRVPCCYQGGKQRIAAQIVDRLLSDRLAREEDVRYFDLCCGSGAITVELLNRGIAADRITMLDISPWSAVWQRLGAGTFDMQRFDALLAAIPTDKHKVKQHMIELAQRPIDEDEAYVYLILQACSFGGKQIWSNGQHWHNAFFRSYWEPTEQSVRRSPANPMQPSPTELRRRVASLAERCKGLVCLSSDIMDFASTTVPAHSIVYVDPPYRGTTSYGYTFDIDEFIRRYLSHDTAPLYVSEGVPLNESSRELLFGGAKGGISGTKPRKHREWLSVFNAA